MAVEQTLSIIKSDGVQKNLIGVIVSRFENAGLEVVAARMMHLSKEQAQGFYAVHKERPFYNDLVAFMTSGQCIPMVLEKENSVSAFRELIGVTDPAEASEGTIRKEFATSKQNNIVHGSDSPENAKIEVGFFFSRSELT